MDDIDNIRACICLDCANYIGCNRARRYYVYDADDCKGYKDNYQSEYAEG